MAKAALIKKGVDIADNVSKARANKARAKANLTKSEREKRYGRKVKLQNVLGYLLAGGVTLYAADKVIKKIRRNKAINTLDSSTKEGKAGLFAERFYTAFIQVSEFVNDTVGDGTDEQAIFQLAKEMGQEGITLADVSKQYRKLHPKRDFLKDFAEIDANDKAEFDYIYQQAKIGGGQGKRYGYVRENETAKVYKSVSEGWLFGGESGEKLLTTLNGGQMIGEFKGISTEDFYQMATLLNGDQYTFYVAKDLVTLKTIFEANKTNTQKQEIIANYNDGISGIISNYNTVSTIPMG